MSIRTILLSTCLVVSTAAYSGSALHATLLGDWELTGVGGPHNLITPARVALALGSRGAFRLLVWEQGDVVPQEVTGRYRVSDDVLELVVPGSGPPETFQVTWVASALVLQPVDSDQRPEGALWFEKQPWLAP